MNGGRGKVWFWLALAALSLALLVGCKKHAGDSGKPRVAVIPKGTTHEFWKSVHAGAVKAAASSASTSSGRVRSRKTT